MIAIVESFELAVPKELLKALSDRQSWRIQNFALAANRIAQYRWKLGSILKA